MKKRVVALLLAFAAVFSCMSLLAGCASGDKEEDNGAEIAAFFVGEVYDFDPAKAYTNDDAMKVMSLIYETLFNLDENGNLQYGLADSYKFYEDRGDFCLDINLRNTYWNDGSQVTAADVVYAWQRILDPNFPSQAATLLYDIKYAKEAKLNTDGITKFDAAISAQDQLITIIFKHELTAEGQENFLRNLTSVALAPVRETAVTSTNRDNWWTKRVSTIVTNGPFAIRAMDYGYGEVVLDQLEFRLERNNYYRRPQGASVAADTYVTPYKFLTYWDTELTDAFAQYLEGAIFYVGDIPLEEREAYLKKANLTNLLSTYTYVLDNDDPVFANTKVRRALSIALDRALLAADATKGLGVPATGLVSHGVLNGASGSFSDATVEKGYGISTSADLEAAAELIKTAVKEDGYQAGDINILIRNNAEELAIADMVKTAWETVFRAAGLKISINVHAKSDVKFTINESDTDVTMPLDAIQEAYSLLKWNHDPKSGSNGSADISGFVVDGKSYNVVGIDYQMLSPDAFSVLASFSYELSGNGIQLGGFAGITEIRTHICGFNDMVYNEVLNEAYNEADMERRNRLLHWAEKLLLDEMPVIPLLFNRSASLASSKLNRVYTNYYGYAVFTRTELRNYHKYLSTEEKGA